MASTWSNAALADIQSGALDLDTDTLNFPAQWDPKLGIHVT